MFLETNFFLTIILLSALSGIGVAFYLARLVLSHDPGNEKMKEVGGAILTGANAYLKRQFTTIAPIIVVLTIFLYVSAPIRYLAIGR